MCCVGEFVGGVVNGSFESNLGCRLEPGIWDGNGDLKERLVFPVELSSAVRDVFGLRYG